MYKHSFIDASTLLGRELKPVYSLVAKDYFKDKVVLVTGAGGSIGSEIVNQLIKLRVKRVVCLDRDEYALYNLELKIHGTALLTNETLVLADIQDYKSMTRVMTDWQPDMVFHAAAIKHLPILERTPDAAFMINVVGSMNVIRAAIEAGVDRLVNVSTDKAANPTSVLGYSKRLAEMVASHYANQATRISSVRFGNVFASRGSFIETLQWQIANGRDITLTDKNATRYFMSIPQAASLVIETSLIAEPGNTYVLDMGEPVKIIDVVERYAQLAKQHDLSIVYSGLRKGEKMHEVLYDLRERDIKTPHDKIFCVRVTGGDANLINDVEVLEDKIKEGNFYAQDLADELRNMAAGRSRVRSDFAPIAN